MRITFFAFIWFAALAVAPITLSADTPCCDMPMACCEQPAAAEQPAKPCCADTPCTMPCCQGESGCDMPCCSEHAAHGAAVEPSAVEVLFAMDGGALRPPAADASPVRQVAVVWFNRPVWVGNTVLMGKHVIEHDTDRQARGEACTHIYAAGDLTTPVATFHCTHLDREPVSTDTVMLQSLPDGMQKLLGFQFAGEHAAHGFPTER